MSELDMDMKLWEYITYIRLNHLKLSSNEQAEFPSKKQLEGDNNETLKILVEQAEKLLTNQLDYCLFRNKIGIKDRKSLLELLINDIEQFATIHSLVISDNHKLSFSQSQITGHSFFHLASSSILPKTYESIGLCQQENIFNVYSIPFKLRVAIELKIKSIIGFLSCDITRNGNTKVNTSEFPVTMIIQELIKLKCLELPCNLQSIANIYTWSCSFCHTGKKEYLWMSMKALEILSRIFLFEEQKKKEIKIYDLWHRYVLSEEYLIEKLKAYRGVVKPLYYLKEGWSIDRLQKELNNSKNKSLKPYKFNLSELALDESNWFYCSASNSHV